MNKLKTILLTLTVFLSVLESSYAKINLPLKPKTKAEESLATEETQKVEKEIIKIQLKDVNGEYFTDKVVLQGLNKITAKTFELNGKIGDVINFERLIIKPLKCWQAPPTETPENKVLLKIYERKLNNTEVLIFYGWMFSSSPGLSGLEHPTYDITIKECQFEEKAPIEE